ncbi:MAG: ROK family protein [Candidatus Limnocylindrales bacterium]
MDDVGDWGSGNLVQGSALDAPVLALDLGASRLRAALVGPHGTILSRTEAPSATERGPAAVIATAEKLLTSLGAGVPGDDRSGHVMRGGVKPGDVEPSRTTRGDTIRGDASGPGSFALRPISIAPRPIAIGISAIGPVDPRAGLIIDPPNAHPTFRDVPIAEELGRRLGLPVFLDRDTNVALLGELTYGAAQGVADVVYLTVSTGIGGAVLSNGVLLHGPDGTAGELGHLLVDLDGPPCGCGARGHLEAIASGAAIARAAREAVCSGESPLLRAVADRTGPEHASAADVAAAEEAGDPGAAAIMERARRAFAAAMVVIVDVFNPTLVVVGGSIARAQGDRLLQPARDAVRATAFRTPGRRVSVVSAALGDDVSLVGCLPLVRRRQGGASSEARGPSRR